MNARERAELRELHENFKRPPNDRPARCAMCGYVGPFIEAHHALGKATLKRALLRKGKPLERWHSYRQARYDALARRDSDPRRTHERSESLT